MSNLLEAQDIRLELLPKGMHRIDSFTPPSSEC